MLIVHLHAGEATFEETLASLQFADRCRNIELKDKRSGGIVIKEGESKTTQANNSANNDRIIKKLTSELNDLQKKMENINNVIHIKYRK